MDQETIPAKPKSVIDSVNILWASIAVAAIGDVLNILDPQVATVPMSSSAIVAVAAIGGGLSLLIWWWIISKISAGRNWARIVFFVFLGIGLLGAPFTIPMLADMPLSHIAAYVVNLMLQVVAACLLLGSPAREWFRAVSAWRAAQGRANPAPG